MKTVTKDEKDTSMESDQLRQAAIARLQSYFNTFIQDLDMPAEFEAAEWLDQWLYTPCPALNNAMPVNYLSRPDGEQEILKLWSLMKSSSFA